MTVFIFGEAMLEYHSEGSSGLRYGGDTLNTAIHLARAGHDVAYVTALGTDPISDALDAAWSREGIDTRFVLRHPSRNPGIYAIHLDDQGERSFLYWRDKSAAREMFELEETKNALLAAERSELVYFSLISLAVIGSRGRDLLLDLARGRRKKGMAVAYDSNFRPALWPEMSKAREISGRALDACTIGLPTNTDERALWESDEPDRDIVNRWRDIDRLVALKAGETGCYFASGDRGEPELSEATKVTPVDTSGAGDAFNAGFLSAHLSGQDARKCVEAGQYLARHVIRHIGAVPQI